MSILYLKTIIAGKEPKVNSDMTSNYKFKDLSLEYDTEVLDTKNWDIYENNGLCRSKSLNLIQSYNNFQI